MRDFFITRYEEAVEDFFDKLHIFTKIELKHTPRSDLICYHLTLGQAIRYRFSLWHNAELVYDTGCTHPDEASYKILVGFGRDCRMMTPLC